MSFPDNLSRTKNWGTEILTDTDLEGQLDNIISWVDDAMDVSNGHDHDGSENGGKAITTLGSPITSNVTFSGAVTISGTIAPTPSGSIAIGTQAIPFSQVNAGTVRADTGIFTTLQTGTSLIPTGIIVMWSGTIASIPATWYLCDGNNGTPNLTNRFVYGASDGSAAGNASPGSTGGLTPANNDSSVTTASSVVTGGNTEQDGNDGTAMPQMNHTHNVMPPYYALAFIMKG